ncbi:hypothetical protein TWF481_006007 [Arthrobotrys musiformis]|uniref:Uncharacterized protein n=1 Tax=Arthrobotrys musiformis TaxID=47236 RepID=A0AAV9WHH8_9PEZI
MCYDLKTFRCGHYKRTFNNCRCTLYCSGEQRRPTYCGQWHCNRRPYYSDGFCERDHISYVNIGHYFNPETGRRNRYRPGQRIRSLRPHRRGVAAMSDHSSVFSIPSILDYSAIHPDELILDQDPYEFDDTGVLEVGVGFEIRDGGPHPDHRTGISNISEIFSNPRISPGELFDMIARELGARDSNNQPMTDVIENIVRMASSGVGSNARSSLPRATVIQRTATGTVARPLRGFSSAALRPSAFDRILESTPLPLLGGHDLMDIDEDPTDVGTSRRRDRRPRANPRAGPSTNNNSGRPV